MEFIRSEDFKMSWLIIALVVIAIILAIILMAYTKIHQGTNSIGAIALMFVFITGGLFALMYVGYVIGVFLITSLMIGFFIIVMALVWAVTFAKSKASKSGKPSQYQPDNSVIPMFRNSENTCRKFPIEGDNDSNPSSEDPRTDEENKPVERKKVILTRITEVR